MVISLRQRLLPLVLLLPVITTSWALPTASSLRDQSLQRQHQTWDIPTLNMHMLSESTGIPGNPPWPADKLFNSTIDFVAILPHYTLNDTSSSDGSAPPAANMTVNCGASFKNGTLPDTMIECDGTPDDQTVSFGMRPYTEVSGNRRPELSFVLTMERVWKDSEGENALALSGGTPITANDAANEPTSYLTCVGGAPFDGLRCKIRSFMSVNKELLIVANRDY